MMTIPIRMPADPEIEEPEIPAEDRRMPFASEKQYLMRETFDGAPTMTYVISAFWVIVIGAWASTFAIAVQRINRQRRDAPGMTSQDGGDDEAAGSPRLEASRA